MKDRIQIEGIWYVKEKPSLTVEINIEDIINSLKCLWETNNWCFEATILLEDDALLVGNVSGTAWIEITDKRPLNMDDWITDSSDNPNWFRGVLEESSESMEEANKMFDEQGLAEFRAFIKHLINKGWL
jgi:hypothetical protein